MAHLTRENKENKVVRGVTIACSEFPQSLPVGARCDFVCVPIDKLMPGELVVIPSGEFRRFVGLHGSWVWVSNENGLAVDCLPVTGSMYRAEVGFPKATWLLGTLLGLIPGLVRAVKSRVWEEELQVMHCHPGVLGRHRV